jgi:hypothetical protein
MLLAGRRVVWVCMIVAAQAACRGGTRPAKDDTTTAAAPGPTSPTAEASGDAIATLNLIEAGAAPRRVAAYSPGGERRRVVLSWELSQGVPARVTASLRLSLSWQSPATRREPWRFDVETADFGPPDASPEERELLAGIGAMFAMLAGEVTPSGARFHVTQTPRLVWTTPSLAELLGSVLVPLPEQAIGVGAKWEVLQMTPASGARLTRAYELITVDDDLLTIRVHTASSSGGGPGSAPPDVGTLQVQDVTDGTVTIHTRDILPVSATLTSVLTHRLITRAPAGTGDAGIEEIEGTATGVLRIGPH